MRYEDKLLAGYTTAALAATYQSEARFRPEFLSNNPEMGKKVLSSIEEELAHCDQFRISVAFITKSGIVALKQILLELEERGIPGEILTTDYLTFSEPEALKQLAKLKNITRHLHMKAMNHDIHSLFCTLYLDISLFLANILLIV